MGASPSYLPLADEPDAERFIDAVLPGVHESGSPFVDWFFGGSAQARSALSQWMARPSSEAFIRRATLRLVDDQVVGGLICLPGSEVASCRVADAMAAAKLAEVRQDVATRLRAAQALFPEVEPTDFYISRMWVSPEHRGWTHGLAIVRECLEAGRRSGFHRVRADTCSTNRGAHGLVKYFGFDFVTE